MTGVVGEGGGAIKLTATLILKKVASKSQALLGLKKKQIYPHIPTSNYILIFYK